MATQHGRRRHPVDITELNETPDSSTSRYDMTLRQNWTVAQLRTELSKNNVPFKNTAKKAKLIQLCRVNGLINSPNDSAQLQSSSTSQIGSKPSASNISELTKVVLELQKTVQELAGSVTKLHNTNLTQDNSLPSTSADVSQSLCSSQSQMADLLGRSHNSSHTETTHVLQDTNPQISQLMSSSMDFPCQTLQGTKMP